MGRRLEDMLAAAARWLRRLIRPRLLAILAALMVGSGVLAGAAVVFRDVDNLEEANGALRAALENIDATKAADAFAKRHPAFCDGTFTESGECRPPPFDICSILAPQSRLFLELSCEQRPSVQSPPQAERPEFSWSERLTPWQWRSFKWTGFALKETFLEIWREDQLTRVLLLVTSGLAVTLLVGLAWIYPGGIYYHVMLFPIAFPILAALLALALKYLLILLTMALGEALAVLTWLSGVLGYVFWFIGKVADAYRYDRWMTRYERWQRRRTAGQPAAPVPAGGTEVSPDEGPAAPSGRG